MPRTTIFCLSESAAGSRKAARFAYHVLRPIASGEERAQRKHREILTMNYKEAPKKKVILFV
jgi:hypothetical protein